ncbi:MAG: GntR family transcriptional regulator [Paracoccaceae bacterium]
MAAVFEPRKGLEMEQAPPKHQAFYTKHEGYQKFIQAMHDLKIAPGSTVTQTDLCEILEMSVTPLRECLVLLEEYGLVTVRPRAGVQVVNPDVSFFRENMQFRTLIETNALSSFVEKADMSFLEPLRRSHEDCLDRVSTAKDPESISKEVAALDRILHVEIVEAMRNRSISAVHHRLLDNFNLSKLVHIQLTYRENTADTIKEHLLLIDAAMNRDQTAAHDALRSHLRASTHRTFT